MEEIVTIYKHLFVPPTKVSEGETKKLIELSINMPYYASPFVLTYYLTPSNQLQTFYSGIMFGEGVFDEPKDSQIFYSHNRAQTQYVLQNIVEQPDSQFKEDIDTIIRFVHLLLCAWIDIGCPAIKTLYLNIENILQLKSFGAECGRTLIRTAKIRDELLIASS